MFPKVCVQVAEVAFPDEKEVNQVPADYLSSSFAVLLATGFMRNLLRKDRRKRPNMPVGPIHVDAQYAWMDR